MNQKTQLQYALAVGAAASMALANARLLEAEGIHPAGADFAPDRIMVANATQFVEGHFSQPLTTYAVGWKDTSPLLAELDFLFPPVEVPRRFDYDEAVNAEQFLADTNDEDIRAINSDFKTVKPYQLNRTHRESLNKGLSICVDLDRVANQANWREMKTAKLTSRLLRAELRRSFTLLSAAATNTAKTWDTTAGKDPDLDMLNENVSAADISGIHFNRVYYGETAWVKRLLAFRAQNNGTRGAAELTADQVAKFVGAQRGFQSESRYQSTASAKAQFAGNKVIGFTAFDGQDTEDSSNTKRFWTPCMDGGMFRVYEQQISAKLYIITVEHYSLPAITSTLGIRQLTIS